MRIDSIKALIFDTFGTVADWRTSIIREGEALGARKGWTMDWPAFADEWRFEGYKAGYAKVASGELPWMTVDALHRLQLDRMLVARGLADQLGEAETDHLNRAWHRLWPWADAIPGLSRLKRRFVIAPFSNGNVALLTNMAKHVGLPWDCILSTELTRIYKPDPCTYRMASELLGLAPEAVLMVAAHRFDLDGARKAGLSTAFVARPDEFGGKRKADEAQDGDYDVVVRDFMQLADRLGC